MTKKLFPFLFAICLLNTSLAQITATDFTSTDCSGVAHNLFTELNDGKAIVITWVMPCLGCVSAASLASGTVQNCANPNVKFYLVDDEGNTNCSLLNSWMNLNSISADAVFENNGNAINMLNYGAAGMPKTIVVGGGIHKVFLNINGTPDSSDLQIAIDKALNVNTGIGNNNDFRVEATVFPNPAESSLTIDYALSSEDDIKVEIFNILGQPVFSQTFSNVSGGKRQLSINTEYFNAGNYFLKLTCSRQNKTAYFRILKQE